MYYINTFVNFLTDNFIALLGHVFSAFFVALPIVLVLILWELWVEARRERFFAKQKMVLLQINLPRDVPKSPLAMELILNGFHQTSGETNWYDRYILGKVRNHFSLEIVSTEGNIRFLLWARSSARKFLETQIYSQYPNAEIKEVPDYTATVPYGKESSDWDLFGVEYILSKPDPYPIKTYVDYNLDKDPKEEFKIDPITPLLEYLGDIGRGEQGWFQIIIRSNKGLRDKVTLGRKRDWQTEGKEIIAQIMEDSKERSGSAPEEGGDYRFATLTDDEREVIKAIGRSVSKLGFDCGIRFLYLARKDKVNWANISGLYGTMKQYNSNNLNGFKPRTQTDEDYPWQKYINIPWDDPSMNIPFFSFRGLRTEYKKWKFFDAYRKRAWFFPPYERKPFVLNIEELATIYHFPGQSAETPTLSRIESQKAEPPPNLPI